MFSRRLPLYIGLALVLTFSFGTGCYKSQVQKAEDVVELDENIMRNRPPIPLNKRKRLAVLEFEDKTAYGRGRLGRSASNILTTYLTRSGQFAMYEREKIDQIIGEIDRGKDRRFDKRTAIQAGKLANVELVAIGAVTGFGFKSRRSHAMIFGSRTTQEAEAIVDVKIIDVKTGMIVAAESGRGVTSVASGHVLGVGTSAGYDETTAGNALRAAIVKFVDRIIGQSLAA